MKLENDSKYLQEDLPYRTMFRMAPSSSKEFESISKHFFNFILVRHPFSRLVSAYLDRVRDCKMKAEWYSKGRCKLQGIHKRRYLAVEGAKSTFFVDTL